MLEFARYQQASQALRLAVAPLIVVLKHVDADALGSAVALTHALKRAGVTPTLFCAGEIPEALVFLAKGLSVTSQTADLLWREFDLAVVVDAGSLERTGLRAELSAFRITGKPILNIDHHHAHEPFGTINLIDEAASATCVLVYDIIKLAGWDITPPMATALLSGIVADTDNFTNAATSVRALTVAAECYARGADVRRVTQQLYRNRGLEALQLWGEILMRLKLSHRWGIVSTVIRQDDFARYRLNDEAVEGLSNFMNSITGIKAALVVTELKGGQLRVSLRTTNDTIDVSRLAARLGGGGHKKAAGFTMAGRIIETDKGWKVVEAGSL